MRRPARVLLGALVGSLLACGDEVADGAGAGGGGGDPIGGAIGEIGGKGGGHGTGPVLCSMPGHKASIGLVEASLSGRSAALANARLVVEHQGDVGVELAVPYRGGVVLAGRSGFYDVPDLGAPPQWVPSDHASARAYLAGDLDEDGDDDLLSVHEPDDLSSVGRVVQLWERVAQGAGQDLPLVPRGAIEVGRMAGSSDLALTLADADRDGHLDLVTIEHIEPAAYLGDGAFGFRRQTAGPSLPLGAQGELMAVKVVDMNGDDAPDLVAVIRDHAATPTFLVTLPGTPGELFGEAIVTELDREVSAAEIADVTRDGVPDVALLYWDLLAADYPVAVAAGSRDGAFELGEPFSRVSETQTAQVGVFAREDGSHDLFTVQNKWLTVLRASEQSPVTLEPSEFAVEAGHVGRAVPNAGDGEPLRFVLHIPCGPSCDGCAGRCLLGRCLECASDDDCAQGVCSAARCVACVEASGCADDEQCAEGTCSRTVSSADGWRAVATTGLAGACAIDGDGALRCWGASIAGQTPAGTWGELAAGSMSALAVSDAELFEGYGCAIRESGELACWASQDGPKRLEVPPGRFRAISARGAQLCGILVDDTALCWSIHGASVESPPAGEYAQIAVASSHGCAIARDGSLRCWGCGAEGSPPPDATGDAGPRCYDDHGQARPPAGRYDALAVADSHGCAIERETRQLRCWGRGFEDWVSPARRFSALATTNGGACALDEDGALHCFGTVSWRPRATAFSALSAGFRELCGLRSDGRIECSASTPP